MAADKTPLDEGHKNLRPRARLLRTLGQELISSEVVALVELVKNSYDADATSVLIRFNGPLEIGRGSIEVLDNGHGMDLNTVRTVWMEPATRAKRDSKRSPGLKRRLLGEKGIGRFASARLADELEVVSKQSQSSNEVVALFDWRQFDDEELFLDQVVVLWEERAAVAFATGGVLKDVSEKRPATAKAEVHGTSLKMVGLRQSWERKHLEELTRALARLVAPDSDAAPSNFEIRLELPEQFADLSTSIRPPAILKYPHYKVNGKIEADGSYSFTYHLLSSGKTSTVKGHLWWLEGGNTSEFRAVDGDGERPEGARPPECGPLSFELRVWDRDELGNVVQKTNSSIKDVRRDLDSVAGINIYRDGFRVLPYGEPHDDWLRLDLRRVQNPTLRLSNNQIYGVVQISADLNPELRDQSNREGLDSTRALEELRGLLLEALVRLEGMRYESRPRPGPRSARTRGGLFDGFSLKAIAERVTSEHPKDAQTLALVGQVEKSIDAQLKEIQTVLARYQRLATLGQLIDHVLHEARQPLAAINNEAFLGVEDSKKLAGEAEARLGGRFGLIRKQGDVLSTAFRRMEPFGGRKRGRPAQLYLEDIVADAVALFATETKQLGIRLTTPSSQTLVRVDPAELQEVIINLYQNSVYWLEQTPKAKRAIAIEVQRTSSEEVVILFSDSGPGVAAANKDLIFEPYFTTKVDGIGLGLSIAGEIVSDYYDGSLELLQKGPLPGATFKVTLRKRV